MGDREKGERMEKEGNREGRGLAEAGSAFCPACVASYEHSTVVNAEREDLKSPEFKSSFLPSLVG